jgi:hypothetical protein
MTETLCACSRADCAMCGSNPSHARTGLAQVYEPTRVALMSDEQVVREYRHLLGELRTAWDG